MKYCSKCNTEKSFESFGFSSQTKDRLKPSCNECLAEYSRSRRKNPDLSEREKSLRRISWRNKNPNPQKRQSKKNDPEYIEFAKARAKQRMENPAAKKSANEAAKRHYHKKKAENPDFLVKQNEKSRAKYSAGGKRKEIALQCAARWRKENPGHKLHMNKQRELAKDQRTPTWADLDAIKEIYVKCPDGHHVDHVIPLRGTLVSGLHVENNLQYLTPEENMKKGNRFDQDAYQTSKRDS